MNPLDRAVEGAAGAPLDNLQKGKVCAIARTAWARLGKPYFSDQARDLPVEVRLGECDAFLTWRQDQQRKAVGKTHLTACQQRDFPTLMAHFADLAGQKGKADFWTHRNCADDQRRALAALGREFTDAQDVINRPESYVSSIARCRFKTTDLRALSPKQLWSLVFDLRRNASRRRAKGVATSAAAGAGASNERTEQ